MSDVQITITLPEDLVREARANNLLTDAKIAELLQTELERMAAKMRRLRVFLDTADQLAVALPHLTPEEIEAETEAARRERSE